MQDIKIEVLDSFQIYQFQNLVRLYNNVFESPDFKVATQEYCKSLLTNSKFIAIAAKIEGAIVGGITAHVLPSYYSGKDELFIYDLAILEDFRRKGIGRCLIKELFIIGADRNIEVAFVDAENEDIGALHFYKALGGVKLSTSQFTFRLKRINNELQE